MPKLEPISALIVIILIGLTAYVFFSLAPLQSQATDTMHFLDVGQGDSHLLTLGPVRMMTDFGPDMGIVQTLTSVIPASDRTIDIVLITHPEKDHYGGLRWLLDRYRIGIVVWNGYTIEGEASEEWESLLMQIEALRIPMVALGAGDSITYAGRRINILSPDPALLGGAEANDTGLVQKVHARGFTALLTADTGFAVEQYLASQFDLSADILKIGHHGSKFSSSDTFLRAVHPSLAIIQSGDGNTYGHPSTDVLARIASSTAARIFRTDIHGTITITSSESSHSVLVSTEK